jgi:hypothetical protein
MPACCFGFSIRIEDQTLTPVDILNANAKDFLRAHPCVLNYDKDILHWLFCDSEQLRLSFRINGQFTAYFLHQPDSRCNGNHFPLRRFAEQPPQCAKCLIDVGRRTRQC